VVAVRRSQRVQGLLKLIVQQGHISEVQILKSSDAVENIPTREHEAIHHNANEKEREEETPIHEALKAVQRPPQKKLALKS